MVQGFVSLIFTAIFFLAIGLCLYVPWKLGEAISVRLKTPHLGAVGVLLVVIPAVVWSYASYATFESACALVEPPTYLAKPIEKQSGYAIEMAYTSFLLNHFNPYIPFRNGSFQFIQEGVGRRQCEIKNGSDTSHDCKSLESEATKYVVRSLPLEKSDYWWNPPIYRSEIQIEEIGSKRLMARASELIFGGGLLGTFMRMKGGDQDFEFLGCGYVSPQPGLYRPTLDSRPRVRLYEAADERLINLALTP